MIENEKITSEKFVPFAFTECVNIIYVIVCCTMI